MTQPAARDAIRPATAGDVAAIRALTRAAYARWVPVIGREPLPMGADYALAVRTHRFDLLERDGALVALVETVLQPDHIWVENLAVSPAHQGGGLGRRMLGEAERVGRALGHRRIRLLTNRAFATNLAFYRRAGYGTEREEPIRDGVVVHLGKAL